MIAAAARWQSVRLRLTRTPRKPARHADPVRRGSKRTKPTKRPPVLAAWDTETIRLFIEMNQPVRLARILRETGEMAQSGPAGRQAALLFLCELRDAVTAKRLNAELRRAGITHGPVGVA
jgi:hypothetical protein